MVKEQYHEADVCKKISEIQFSIFSPDDMAKSSHIQVRTSMGLVLWYRGGELTVI